MVAPSPTITARNKYPHSPASFSLRILLKISGSGRGAPGGGGPSAVPGGGTGTPALTRSSLVIWTNRTSGALAWTALVTSSISSSVNRPPKMSALGTLPSTPAEKTSGSSLSAASFSVLVWTTGLVR